MTETGKRSYSSDLRAEQARATRQRIVAAAGELFAAHGYAATTIDDVARAAGVSRKTVFTAVGGKVVLVKLAFDWAVAGDDEDVPMMERPVIQRLRASTDPVEVIDGYAAHLAETMPRVAPIALAVEAAAASGDPDAVALLEDVRRQRLFGMTMMARQLHDLRGLRRGLGVPAAADLLWLMTDPAPYDLLVRQRGWTPRKYADWLARATRASVLRPELVDG
ncbi:MULTISPECIES: TetR/AcrR family transcriptional regulator [unclassified Nocardioides]|uniref:TetR/AcrR family transcriptional regulator n=1 Tax=unclassified Nocardioides TaxID=2615069 RepID=UPI00114E539E|nr:MULTISPECIES: TetR/AcrR family transcriptional regulator [unclassified Nocardioides]TQK69108.1 TetR family transcriptional regulator [Nocardioides sp. SLBN-35]WGY01586.1 helix-turn-helix domain-containing protein [Nocardioides sp. QY071]